LIIRAIAVAAVGAILAAVWGIRRLRWRGRMKRHREALAAGGGEVD